MSDYTARLLVERAGVTVVAVDYRLAPEHPYPAGLADCYAVLQWAVAPERRRSAEHRNALNRTVTVAPERHLPRAGFLSKRVATAPSGLCARVTAGQLDGDHRAGLDPRAGAPRNHLRAHRTEPDKDEPRGRPRAGHRRAGYRLPLHRDRDRLGVFLLIAVNSLVHSDFDRPRSKVTTTSHPRSTPARPRALRGPRPRRVLRSRTGAAPGPGREVAAGRGRRESRPHRPAVLQSQSCCLRRILASRQAGRTASHMSVSVCAASVRDVWCFDAR